ncbi:WD40 repeat domain-containing serine/threonine protein kinase [Tropicimonas marinistellae]|uniref:WD40 repeat domain-containing serine/threonine protein kinase n=1 Tax=Tropicimonas marinistellae TaxID=1739787 RepID=UPI0008307370|nr:WD40 repeat domain-containing serine/threonine-protein kinase [Tropicimonas marinistellae]
MELPAYIGRHVLRREIARGSFAVVVLAWDEELECQVAIKILDERAVEGTEGQARFLEEARLLRRIRSHSVISVHDFGRLSDGRPYIVMDFADLGTLTRQVARRAVAGEGTTGLDSDHLVRLVDAIADGLAAIHRAGVVHRDLKPDNILYQSANPVEVGEFLPMAQPDDATVALPVAAPASTQTVAQSAGAHQRAERIMIADLGIAKDLVKSGHAATLVGGTPAYRPPEQLDPTAEIGPTADIFAATAVIWYTLTGTAPPPPDEVDARLDALPEPWWAFFRQGLAFEAGERFSSVETWRSVAHDALAQVAAMEPAPGTEIGDIAAEGCPYQGLASFQPEHSDRFFGREQLVDELLQRMREQRVLVVGGPSGSGKSSVVRAGLVPAVRAGKIAGGSGWRIDLITPGRDALSELYFALGGSDSDVGLDDFLQRPTLARRIAGVGAQGEPRLLVIDQFEEIFTLNDSAERNRFIDALAALADPADSAVRIVLVIRADFYAMCATLPRLTDWITRNQVLVGPMSNSELRRAITEPARMSGYYLERSLVDTIVDGAGKEPGALPLISHALVETWARRKGTTLTLGGYQASGGVAGALSKTAEAIYETSFDDIEREAARRLLLSLVWPGEDSSDTRRILKRSELDAASDADVLRRVADVLTDARLLTVDDRTIQITHEALLRSWPRLRRWIEDSRNDLRTRLRLVQLAEDWETAGRDEEMLLRGVRLALALEWLEKNEDRVGTLERDFIQTSRDATERREAAAAARQARARRRRIFAVVALAVLAVGASVASLVAVSESRNARANETIAREATDIAQERFAGALGAVARGLVTQDPLLALALAAESLAISAPDAPGFDARAALVAARLELAKGVPVLVSSPVPAGDALSLAMSPDGAFVAVGRRDGTLMLLDGHTRQPVAVPLATDLGGIEDLAFAPDGSALLAVGNRGRIVEWPVADGFLGEPRTIGATRDIVWRARFDPHGEWIASAGEDGTVRLWAVAAPAESGTSIGTRIGDFTSVAFSPRGDALLAGNGAGEIHGWSLPSRALLFPTIKGVHQSDIWDLAFSEDGQLFATVSSDGTSAVFDFPSARLQGRAFDPDARIGAIGFLPGQARLLGATGNGELAIWDLEKGETISTSPSGHRGAIVELALDRSGTVAATLGADQMVRFWRLGQGIPPARTFAVPGQRAKGVALGADIVLAGDDTGAVTRWEASDPAARLALRGHDHQVWALDLSMDGQRLVSADRGGTLQIQGTDGSALTKVADIGEAIWSVDIDGGSHVFAASDRSLQMFDPDTNEMIRSFDIGGGQVTRAVVDQAGTHLAAALTSGDVLLWGLAEDAPPRVLSVDDDVIWTVSFNPDGRYLLAGTSDEVVTVWDVATLTQVAAFTGHVGGATDALFLGDTTTIAAIDRRGGLHLWDLESARRIASVPGAHSRTAWRLARHPDGARFASAGDDGKVRLWDLLDLARACEMTRGVLDPARRLQYLGAEDAAVHCNRPAVPGTQPEGSP